MTQIYSQLLIQQYATQPKAVATVQMFDDAMQEIWTGMRAVMDSLNFDMAFGKSLDNIAARVGATRILKEGVARQFFGFTRDPDALGFGGSSGYTGGRFYRFGGGTYDPLILDDIDLLTFIKMRVWKNKQQPTFPYLFAFLAEFFGENNFEVIDNEDMTFTVNIFGTLTPIKQTLITRYDCIPRPCGVKMLLNTTITPIDSLYRFSTVNLPALVN